MKKNLLLIVFACVCLAGFSQTLPTGFYMTDVTPGVSWVSPVGALFSKDGQRLFVWERRGRVYVCNRQADGTYSRQSQAVINISDEVGDWRDFGLLGFAIDPNFESNGHIYLYYVVDRHHLRTGGLTSNGYNPNTNEYYAATIGRVTKYTTVKSGNTITADMATRKVLLGESASTGVPILYESHGTGGLVFAQDGTLLLTSGDGASYTDPDGGNLSYTYYTQALADGIITPAENVGAFRSQLLNSHSGKLLRINPENGDGVSSNPFYDPADPRSAKSRVWALGFRNPFRVSVKPGTGSTNPSTGDIGEIFVGDVGWSTWEELNVVKAPGQNFGWPLYEGQTAESSYTAMNTQNAEMPNPFGSCSGRPNLRFKDLLRQDNEAKDKRIYNPCNQSQLIGNHNRFIHARPAIDWRHGMNQARVGRFDDNGQAISPTIGTAASEVAGNPFAGNCTAGGVWYTGAANRFPSEYNNTFIAAEYVGNWIRRFTMDYTDVVTKVDNFVSNAGGVVCLAENPLDGSIVVVNLLSTTLKKIDFGGNIPPVPIIKANAYYTPLNELTVNFDGTGSFDQDGTITSYNWTFDGQNIANRTSTQSKPTRTFRSTTGPRKFNVTLRVTDNNNTSRTTDFIVSVNNTPPQVNITSPEKNSLYKVSTDTVYVREAIVTDNEHSGSQLTYEWQTTLVHDDHIHPETIKDDVQSPTLISRIGCNGDDYSWLVTLKVTDAAGLSAIDSSRIFPDCAGTLPVFLHKFSVTQSGNTNLVKWTTEIESDMEYFELERSQDGINFSPINRQPAQNGTGPNNYSYADKNFPTGASYYRLKMVELGNIISYSIIIKTITQGEKQTLKISPNPVVDKFSLQYHAAQDEVVTIQIKDISGRTLKTFNEGVVKGQNLIYIQNLPKWSAGVYILSVTDKNETQQLRFVKSN